MRKRVLLLANPVAGTEKAKKELMPIVCALTEKGCEVTVYPIEPEKGLVSESILRDAKGRFDLVMCIGGDGTLNHVINGMMKNDFHVPISYIPGGSTNDFSRNINGDLDWEALCCIAAGNRSFRYDIGKLNDRYFNYIAGFGAFTEISYSTNQNMKKSTTARWRRATTSSAEWQTPSPSAVSSPRLWTERSSTMACLRWC